MRRNGVSPFFSLSLFNFRCCSSTLTQSHACTGYVTGKRYPTSPLHLLTISYLSLYLALRVSTSDACFLSNLSRCCKKKLRRKQLLKYISGELQSSWCDECVSFAYFALVAPMLASFMPFVKGLLLKNFSCF